MGINVDGLVRKEVFEEAQKIAKMVKEKLIETAPTDEDRKVIEEHWLFQDHEEID